MGQEFDQKAMERFVKGLHTKSDKIRKLRAQQFARSDVARFLGIRPQFVRNVEVYDQRRALAQRTDAHSSSTADGSYTRKIRVSPDGSVVIPQPMRDMLGLGEGDTLWISVDDGEIRLADAHAVAKRVQEMVRKFVPEGVSLVDELISERRREAKREMRGE